MKHHWKCTVFSRFAIGEIEDYFTGTRVQEETGHNDHLHVRIADPD